MLSHNDPPVLDLNQRSSRLQFRQSPWVVASAFIASTALTPAAAAQTRPAALPGADPALATPDQPRQPLSIPGGALGDVLAAFTRATGIVLDVRVPAEALRVLYSPGAGQGLTDRQTLDRILEGTDLVARFDGSGKATIQFQSLSESVDVTATAPTVSSSKFTAPLRDIPQTINVLKSDLLQQQGASTLRDALRNVTGITFQAGEGGAPAGDQMTIRGFSARTDMFVDGVRDSGGYSRDTFNLEQVEVAKGPASAITGRGSTGGSINLVSKAPRLAKSLAGTVEGGSAEFKRATFDANAPIAQIPGAAIRLNAMVTDAGVAGRDVAHDSRWAVAPTVEFGIRTPTRVAISYLHMSQDNEPDYGLPWVPATNVPLSAHAGGRAPAPSSNYYGLANRDYEKVGNDIATLQAAHTFHSGVTVSNVTRIGRTDRDSIFTSPRFASNASTDIRRTDVKFRDQRDGIAANQTSLTMRARTGGLTHDLVAGAELSRERSKNFAKAESGPETPVSPNTDLYRPNPFAPYSGIVARTGAYTDGVAASAGAYAFDTVGVGPWQITGGLRWDRFAVDYDSVTAAGAASPLSRTDAVVSGRAGVVFKPQEIGSLYAGYASAFNPSAEGLALTSSTVGLEPEKTRTFEAGTKWDLAGERLAVNAAVFRTEKTNARTPGINPGDPPTVLAGRQAVSGIELGASGAVTPRWTGMVAYSFMRSDIDKSNTPGETEQAMALTPEHTFSLWSTYAIRNGLRAGGGAQFMDGVFRNATNTLSVPSYWLANALVEYDVNQHLTLRLNGNNLGDTDYVDRVSGGHYLPGPRRAVILSTAVRF